MAAGQGPAAAAGGKAGPPLAAVPGTGGLRGGQGRPPREARPSPRQARDRRPPRTPQAAGPVARAAPFLPRSAATDRRPDGGGPVEARVVVPLGAARVVVPWRGVSPLRDAKKWRRPLPGRGWKRRKKEKGGLGLLAGPPSNGLSRATCIGATACGGTQPCHVSCLAAGVPAWQLGRAKAYGATLQEVKPWNLARPKELVFENLNLHGLLLKY